MSLYFHLDQETKNQIPFFKIRIELKEMGPKRALYRDILMQQCTEKEKEALRFLIEAQLNHLGIHPLSDQVNRLTFDHIWVSPKLVIQALKLLGPTGKLFWNLKPLYIDLLTPVEFLFEVHPEELVGKFQAAGKQINISECSWIFPGPKLFFIHKQMLQAVFREIDPKWLSWVYPEPKKCDEQMKSRLKDYFEDGGPLKAPKVLWKQPEIAVVHKPKEVWPFLVLKDRSGAFAELWMDYGSDQVAFHDPIFQAYRDLQKEKYWEKDLLETDYLAKRTEGASYICPMDKVAKSLSFLLEIGWKIIDSQGRRVLKMDQASFELQSLGTRIGVKGSMRYENYEADLKQILGTFNRKQHFIQLSSQEVGLLDPKWHQTMEDLSEEEEITETVSFHRSRIGLLRDFFEHSDVKKDLQGHQLQNLLNHEVAPCTPSSFFHGNLYEYQAHGSAWLHRLYESKCHGLLADEMGLGKTVQVMAFLSLIQVEKPILIVVPTSLVFNWKREFHKFLPEFSIYEHQGIERLASTESLSSQKIIITSYAILRQDHLLFKNLPTQILILDEAQTIKNPDSQIAKIVYDISADFRLAITGTPIENRLSDLWSIFHFLIPQLLGEQKVFQAQINLADSSHRFLKKIKKKLTPFVLRRTKEVIAAQLPEKVEQTVWIEMEEEQKQFYETFLQKSRQGLLKKIDGGSLKSHRLEILETLLRLRQICCHPVLIDPEFPLLQSAKLNRLLEDLEQVIQEKRKVLIYSQFTHMLKLIGARLKEEQISYLYLDGQTQEREAIIQSFQEDPGNQIFLISLKAGGVGLNLTAADYVFLFDPWWNDAVEQQAIDRAHRLGRQGRVIARRYIMAETIEEKIMRIKEHKALLLKDFLDPSADIESISLEDLMELIL